MNLSDKHSSASRYSGKVLLAAIMLVFVFVALAVFAGYGSCVNAISKCDETEARLAAINMPKAIKKAKPTIGVVRGIVYSSYGSSALVDETIVHVGDKIHEITVVEIHNSKVEFAKDGVTWQQTVLEAPHAAWPKPAKNNFHLGK